VIAALLHHHKLEARTCSGLFYFPRGSIHPPKKSAQPLRAASGLPASLLAGRLAIDACGKTTSAIPHISMLYPTIKAEACIAAQKP
jgi:hypothetical protein